MFLCRSYLSKLKRRVLRINRVAWRPSTHGFSSCSTTSIYGSDRGRRMSTAAVPVAPGDLPAELNAQAVGFDFDHIPVIDLGQADQGAEARAHMLGELQRTTEEIGFMTIINHGVPLNTKQAMLAKSEEFFNLPQDRKDVFKQDRETVVGYISTGMENLNNIHKGATTGRTDRKEAFDMSTYEDSPENEHEGAWRWLPNEIFPEDDVPGFTHAMTTYQAAVLALGKRLVDLIGEALFLDNIEKTKILRDSCHQKTVCHHRLLHYPPLQNFNDEISTGAHIDYGLLTILATDAVSGLQVLNAKKKVWIHVPPREDGLVINFGHMLSTWTGGRAKAAVHRVVNVYDDKPRFSSPYFFRPSLNTVLNPRDFDPEAETGTTTCREVLDMFYSNSSLLQKGKTEQKLQK